jgi:hypothetical protein
MEKPPSPLIDRKRSILHRMPK